MEIPKQSLICRIFSAFSVGFFTIIGAGVGFFLLFILVLGLFMFMRGATPDFSYKVVSGNDENEYKILPQGNKNPFLLKVNLYGEISDKSKFIEELEYAFCKSPYKNNIKGILLYVNSGGGSVFASDAIYRALIECKEKYKIPIYAYVDGVCASGAIYVSSAADQIYSSEISLIGSVGVLSQFFNFSKTLEKLGIEGLTLTAGENKDLLNPFRTWKENEAKMYSEITDFFYDRFISIVLKSRPKLSRESLIEIHGANLYPAFKAKEYGFIDEYGVSLQQVESFLAEKVDIADENYLVIEAKPTWGDSFASKMESLVVGKLKVELPFEVHQPNKAFSIQ